MNLDTLIHIVDGVTEAVAEDDLARTEELLPQFSEELQKNIPKIVESYMQEELSDVREDISYWVEQIGRIMDVISKGDLFAIVDVLHYELRENLTQYSEMMEQKALQI